jgi:hypothetical protein
MLSKRHLARALGYSTRWVELRTRDGMPSHLIGKARWYRLSDVQEWLNTREGGDAA